MAFNDDFPTHASRAEASRVLAAAQSASAISGDETTSLVACAQELRAQGFDLLTFALNATRNPRSAGGFARAAQMVD